MKNPMEDPAGSTIAEVFNFLEVRAAAERVGSEAAIRLVMVDGKSGKPERIAIFATGEQAVRWALIAEGVFMEAAKTETAVVDLGGDDDVTKQ